MADGKTLLGKRLIIEESLTRMRLLFMIERVKHQRALDKERRKLVKKKWKFILPLFSKHQKTGKKLENAYEYLSLNRSRIEIHNILEKMESEDKNIKTDLEKFTETLGHFVPIPFTYETQVERIKLLMDLMDDVKEYRHFHTDGPDLEHFDRMWGLQKLPRLSHSSDDILEGTGKSKCTLEDSLTTVAERRVDVEFVPYFHAGELVLNS